MRSTRSSPGCSSSCDGSIAVPAASCRISSRRVVGRLAPGADVVRAGAPAVGRGDERAGDVGHVDVVARRLSFTTQSRPFAVEQEAAEDRHHAGLAVWVLPRAVDVAEAQHDVRQSVEAAPTSRRTPPPRAWTRRTARAAAARSSPASGAAPRRRRARRPSTRRPRAHPAGARPRRRSASRRRSTCSRAPDLRPRR